MFSFGSTSVSGFTVRSLVHVELVFVQGDRYGSNSISLCMDNQSMKMFSFFWFFETGFLCVALAGLELTEIHLILPPESWD